MSARRRLAILLALGACARAAWIAWVPVVPVSDSAAYFRFAENLALHGVFGWSPERPDAYWPPGAPALYALSFLSLGVGAGAVVAVNLALAGAKIALLSSLAAKWYGERAAWVAGAVVAVAPTQIALTTVLTSEMAFDAALLAAVAWHERHWRQPTPASGAALGVLLAAASFVRPTALPLGIALAALAMLRGAPRGRTALAAAVSLGVMAAAIAPWALRNHALFGRTVLISANGGANLWMGNNPDSRGVYMALPRETRGMDTAERNEWLGAQAQRWMREHPGEAAALSLRKLAITHERETIGIVWNEGGLREAGSERWIPALKSIATAAWWAVLVLGLAGIAVRVRHTRGRAMLGDVAIALWAYFAVVHAITVAQDRYHLPSVPYAAALAGVAVDSVRMRHARAQQG